MLLRSTPPCRAHTTPIAPPPAAAAPTCVQYATSWGADRSMMAPPPRPVTLRDFLELACDSSSDGFRSYPRRLAPPEPRLALVAEADDDQNHQLLRRSPSRSPSSSRFSLPRISSSLSRTFSRRIFSWRRRFDGDDDEEEEAAYACLDERDSAGFPSPLVSSCSSDSEEADDVTSSEDVSKPASSSSSSADAAHGGGAADGNKMEAVAEGDDSSPAVGRKLEMEDKQHLSPVSVLDFPFDDDDGEEEGTCSPAFITRTKQHKVQRYDPLDLDARFVTAASESGESVGASTRLATSSSSTTDSSSSGATATTAPGHGDEEEHQSAEHPSPPCQEEPRQDPDYADECRLLARLLQEGFSTCLADDEVAQALVLDFFTDGVADRLRSVSRRRRVAEEEEALVRAAAEWLRGEGPRWGVADVVLSGKAALADMERGRRWMCVVGEEEERDIGEAVEGMVLDALVDDMVTELLVPCC